MARYNLQGLKGLLFEDLSEEEKQGWINRNRKAIKAYGLEGDMNTLSKIYNARKFKKRFGSDMYHTFGDDDNARNTYLKNFVTQEVFASTFGNETNYEEMNALLDPEEKYSLLQSDYKKGADIKRDYGNALQAAKKDQQETDAWEKEHPFLAALSGLRLRHSGPAASMSMSEDDFKSQGERQHDTKARNALTTMLDEEKHNNELYTELTKRTQERREKSVEGLTNNIYNQFSQLDKTGQKTFAQLADEFEKNILLSEDAKGYYAAFKDTDWLDAYTPQEKVRDYAKFMALYQQYGYGVALDYLNKNVQNRVAKAQDGKWTGNTLKGIFTYMWANLGSDLGLANLVGKSYEEIGILMDGKDPTKPKYENGKIVDYEYNDNAMTNPNYWNDVYIYNTFDPDEIRTIKEKYGGVSPYVNVREYGHVPEFWSWETGQEVARMSGGALPSLIWSGGVKGGARVAGNLIKRGGRSLARNLSSTAARNLRTFGRKAGAVGSFTTNMTAIALPALAGANMEASGQFTESLQDSQEAIENQIQKELHDYAKGLDLNTKKAKNAISSYESNIKKRLTPKGENIKTTDFMNEQIHKEAVNQYLQDMMNAKRPEIEAKHNQDMNEARTLAAKSYIFNLGLNAAKEAPLLATVQNYKIAKGVWEGVRNNSVKNIVSDAVSGGVKTIKELTPGKFAKATAEKVLGGFADEYLDGVNNSFAGGMNNNMFRNYIDKTYNPEYYRESADTYYGNFLSGMNSAIDGMTDWQNVYEGLIGALSGTGNVAPNVGAMVLSPHDTYNAVFKGIDNQGNKINIAERMNAVINNPILQEYATRKATDRQSERTKELVNDVVSANKEALENTSKLLGILDHYDSELGIYKLGTKEEEESEEKSPSPTVLDGKDKKLLSTFHLIDVLNTLNVIPGGDQAALYQQVMHTMEGLANDNLSNQEMDKEVQSFLGANKNRTLLEGKTPEEAAQIAKERLQKNAQYFMQMKDKMQEIYEAFEKSPSLRNIDSRVKSALAYNLVAEEDYKERLKTIENELGVGLSDTSEEGVGDISNRYGTKAALNSAITGNKKTIEGYKKDKEELEKRISAAQEKQKELQHIKETSGYAGDTKEERLENQKKNDDALRKQSTLVQSLQFQLNTLNNQIENAEEHQSLLESSHKTFDEKAPLKSEEDILNMNASDRAYVLNPDNWKYFSKAQQKIFQKTLQNLQKKDPDAAVKIRDAGLLYDRLKDSSEAYAKLMENSELATSYIDAVQEMRTIKAIEISTQRDIDEGFRNLDKAFRSLKKNREANVRNTAWSLSSSVLEEYAKQNPERAEFLRPYIETTKLASDIVSVIRNGEYSKKAKEEALNFSFFLGYNSNSKEDFIQKLENIIDSEGVDDATKNLYSDILKSLEGLGYQRDATVIEKREKRKAREEKQKRIREERKQRIQEEKQRREAERKAQEEKENASNNASNPSVSTDPWQQIDEGEDVSITLDDESKSEATPSSPIAPSSTSTNNSTSTTTSENQEKEGGENQYKKKWNNFALGGKVEVHKDPSDFIGTVAGFTNQLSDNGKPVHISDTPSRYMVVKDEKGNQVTVDDPAQVTKVEGYSENQTSEEKESNVPKKEVANNEEQHEEKEPENVETVTNLPSESEELAEAKAEKLENNSSTLIGNVMNEYDRTALEERGEIKHKKGKSETDNMSRYYQWLQQNGIHLQKIVDEELAQIIAKNPHAKVKIMTVVPSENVTHDNYVASNFFFLVLDFDDSINKGITSIHKEENGGVIISQGKKYLIIGTVGYKKGSIEQQNTFNILFDKRPKGPYGYGLALLARGSFIKNPNNKGERFCITPDVYTEIVPNSITPGYRVRQREGENTTHSRNLFELVDDEGRNPYGLKKTRLSFGIQEVKDFKLVNPDSRPIMFLNSKETNVGRVFVLVPASNGKMLPIYIRPLFYNEMNEGTLKEKIDSLFQDLTSSDYKTRYNVKMELQKILLFDQSNTILLRENEPVITFEKNGIHIKSFNLDPSKEIPGTEHFSLQAFQEAIKDFNPRINLTARNLANNQSLAELNEAGALQVDISQLSTAGAGYSVYGINPNGTMMQVDNSSAITPVQRSSEHQGEFVQRDENQIVHKGIFYTRRGSDFYFGNIKVTDSNLINQLRLEQEIIQRELSPVKTKNLWDYFVLSDNKENPIVIKRHQNTKEIKQATTAQAQTFLDILQREVEAKRREEEAQKIIEGQKASQETDVPIELDSTKTNKEVEKEHKEVDEKLVKRRNIQRKRMNKHLETMRTSTNPLEVATALFHIETNMKLAGDELDILTDEEKKEIAAKTEELHSQGYEWNVLKVGMQYSDDTKVTADFVPDESLAPGEQRIKSISTPQINKNGVMVQSANIVVAQSTIEEKEEKSQTQSNKKEQKKDDLVVPLSAPKGVNTVTTLESVFKDKTNRTKVLDIIHKKWPDAPKKPREIKDFLREKGVEVDAIPIDEDGFKIWMDTLENCK